MKIGDWDVEPAVLGDTVGEDGTVPPHLLVTGAATGAIPVGASVTKTRGEPGDTNEIGARGTVLSSIAAPPELLATLDIELFPGDEYAYFVEWDAYPGIACFVRGGKIARGDGDVQ